MINLIYVYNESSRLFSNEMLNYLGIFFIIIFLILNFIVVLLHKMYNVDMDNYLNEYFIDINDIDFSKKKIFEVGCLRDSRLPNKRDVVVFLFELINKKHLILSKEYDEYYVEVNDISNIEDISSSEQIILDLIDNKKVKLKAFIRKLSNKYASKKISNEMKTEILKKFDFFKVNKFFIIFFNFLKIPIFISVFTFAISLIYIFYNESASDAINTFTTMQVLINIFSVIDNFVLVIVFIFMVTYCCGYIKKLNNILLNKEENFKFFKVIGIVLIAFMLVFFINKLLAIYLMFVYITALIFNLAAKKYFLNVKSSYLKEKIEAISLEKYIREHSNLKERDSQSVIVYEEYFLYAFAFGITLKVDDDLELNNVLFNEVMKENFEKNISVFKYLGLLYEYANELVKNNTKNEL